MSSTIAPVAIRLVLTVLMLVVKVCPVVIKLPLISSTIAPVATKLVETVLIFVVSVCPVVHQADIARHVDSDPFRRRVDHIARGRHTLAALVVMDGALTLWVFLHRAVDN